MKYPNKKPNINGLNLKKIEHQNRGMNLEKDINMTNDFYKNENVAFIYKKPTPIKVVKVDYQTKYAKIVEGYFETPSTTDYNGIYKGHYLDFEAKEISSKVSIPFANIHNHQLKHMDDCHNAGGIVFIIVRFTKINTTYLLMYEHIKKLLNDNKKSISVAFFEKNGFQISQHIYKRVDYLKIIDKILEGAKIDG